MTNFLFYYVLITYMIQIAILVVEHKERDIINMDMLMLILAPWSIIPVIASHLVSFLVDLEGVFLEKKD
jgi:hypothetical protein